MLLRPSVRLVLVAAAMLTTTAACSGPTFGGPVEERFTATSLTEDGHDHPIMAGTTIFMTVTSDAIAVDDACNAHNYGFHLDGDQIVITQQVSTQVACRGEAGAQEGWVEGFFHARPTWDRSDDQLVLTAGSRTITFVKT